MNNELRAFMAGVIVGWIIIGINSIERFYTTAYEAGRVAEREECAKVCEALPSLWPTERVIADECSIAIRARSTK